MYAYNSYRRESVLHDERRRDARRRSAEAESNGLFGILCRRRDDRLGYVVSGYVVLGYVVLGYVVLGYVVLGVLSSDK
jgi:hypothetical protein